jgi:two-component system chemotaxis sensor kinase CheA
LDLLREQTLSVDDAIMRLLFKSYDILTDLVHAAENNQELEDYFGFDVLEELRLVTERGVDTSPAEINKDVNSTEILPGNEETSLFHITFKPHDNLLHYGNEPILVFKELHKLALDAEGFKASLNASNVPDLFDLLPNNLYMNWNIDITTSENEAEIINAFEFVSDLCDLTIKHESFKMSEPKLLAHAQIGENTVDEMVLRAEVSEKESLSKAPTQALTEASKGDAPIKNDTVHTLRVEIDRIDKLVNTVGEIVIKQSMVINQAKDLDDAQYNSIVNGLHELSQYTRELQENVMAIRAQPIKSVFSRMPRLVRDLASQLNKNVSIETRGEDTEIDKTVIENLSEPLIHIIRNAIDHGIETPEERMLADKPKESKIILSAEHKNGRISIQIKDDGRGINRERVRQKAVEKGLISPDAVLVGDEVDNLILLPGFSTAENITNISGRGVGLDVVKKSVQSLGGRLHIQSQEGKGCSFNLTLPLTLAVLDGMVVSCRGGIYIVPLVNIVETLSPKNDHIVDLVGGMQLLKLRGLTVPLFYF